MNKLMRLNPSRWLVVLAGLLVIAAPTALAANNGSPAVFPFQGRVTDSSGVPVNYPVTINFRIYPPTGTCWIYEETHAITPNAYGIFSAIIGSGTVSPSPANTLVNVFTNDPVAPLADSCSTTYNPLTGDYRRIELVVDGTALASMQTIGSSAFAITAQMLSGKTADDFIQVNSSVSITQANIQTLVNGGDASTLHNHDSLYSKIDGSNSYTGDISTSGDIYAPSVGGQIGIGTGSAAADLHIVKSAPEIRLQSTTGSGNPLEFNFFSGALTQRGGIRASESVNGLQLYSGTSLAVDIDANRAVTFQGSIKSLGTVGLGQYTSAQESALTLILNGMGTAATGTMWTNSTTGEVKYWDGADSQIVASSGNSVSSINGLVGGAQAITVGSGGTAPNVSSAGVTHTINIPMASTVGTTAGLISKTDYDLFAAKENALGFTPVNRAGDAMTGGLTLSADPTANLGASTKQYVDASINTAVASYVRRDGSLTLTADWDVGAWKLTNLGAPVAAGDAANKGYVDTGLATKENALGFTPVNRAGDAMTGGLTLAADPTAALGAATKQYVDNTVSTAGGAFVKIDGTTTLAANWDVGAWKLTNLGAPTAAGDAANKGYVDTGLATKENSLGFTPVNVAGDIMTGKLSLSGDPTANLEAATKQYVDNTVTGASGAFVKVDGTSTLAANWDVGAWKLTNLGAPTAAGDAATKGYVDTGLATKENSLGFTPVNKAGDVMTGGLTLAADPTAALGAATKQYVDANLTSNGANYVRRDGSVTLTSDWDIGAWKLTNLGAPTAAGDAANKSYVDTGLATKENSLGFTPVNKAGDVMTGGLTLAADPTAALGAATKQYVDNTVTGAGGAFLKIDGSTTLAANWDVGAWKLTNLGAPTAAGDAATKGYVDTGLATKENSLGFTPVNKAGDVMTGTLTLSGDPTLNLEAATKQYVDNTVSGAGGAFLKIDGSTTLAANWDVGAWKLTNLGAPTAAGDAATKGYVDTGLATKENSLGFTPVNKAGDVMTGGLTLAGDPTAALGAATKQYVDNNLSTTVSGYVKRDGSLTLSANWDVGAWDLTNLGNLDQAAQKNLRVGRYTAAQEGTFTLTLGATDNGRMWFNTTTGDLRYWDGSIVRTLGVAGSGVQSINGDTSNAQVFTTSTATGTAPAYLTGVGATTLAIPMANTAAVTAGLISKTEFDTFNNKQAALGFTPVNIAGDAMTGGLTLSGDPTAALGAATKQYVDTTVSTAGGSFLKIDGSTTLGANWDVGAWKLTNLGTPTAAGDAATKGYVDTGLATKENSLGFTPVNVAGDVMTGGLTLSGDPTANLGAATKQYVDSNLSTNGANYVKRDGSVTLTANWDIGAWKLTNLGTPTAAGDAANKSYVDTGLATKENSLGFTPVNVAGDVMTGGLTLAADPTAALGAATKQYVDNTVSTAGGSFLKIDGTTTLGANWDVGAWKLTNLGAPTAAGDAATKGYVDTGLATKENSLGFTPVNKAGDVMTGGLTLAADPTAALGAATKQYVDNTVTGAGGAFLKIDGSTTLAANWDVGAWKLTNLGTPTAAGDAATKGYVDTGLATKENSLGFTPVNRAGDAMTGGLTLAADPTAALGAATKQYVDSTVSTDGANYLKKDGSVALTSNWALGGYDLIGAGNISLAAQKNLAFGGYTGAQEGALTAALGAGDSGKVWYNNTSGQLKYWNGSSMQALGVAGAGLTSLNGQSGSTQTFTTNTATGTAPAWNSATDNHELRIPMANTAAVTAGLISKTEFDTFNNKQAALGFTPVNVAGDAMTGGLTLSGDPTAALGAATKQYVDTTVSTAGGSFLKIDGSTTLGANWDVGAWKLTNLGTPTAAGDAATKGYVDTGLATKENSLGFTPVNVAGDVMTGGLTLSGDPTANLGAATKQYVDSNLSSNGANYVKRDGSVTLTANWDIGAWKLTNVGTPTAAGDATNKSYVDTGLATKENSLGFTPVNKAGDVMTGGLTLAADPTAALGAATKQYVDNTVTTAGGSFLKIDGSTTLAANWDVGAWKLTNLGTPTAAGDAATKGYVDTGLATKENSLGFTPVNKAGDVMTGGLTLAADPTAALGAATKQYVDNTVTGAGGSFLKIDGSTTLAANWDVGAWKLTNLGTPTAAGDAATKGYVDTGLATKENSLGFTPVNKAGDVMTGGLTLAADPTAALGAATKQYVDSNLSTSGAAYVKRDGSVTLTANWDLGAWDLTNTGNIDQAAQKNLRIGRYTAAQESALTLSLGGGDNGRMWFNTTAGDLRYWDGSTARALGVAGSGLTSLNGQGGSTQTFSVNTATGTAPAWNSATDNHELRIPMANTATVTAGLISKTEYDTFNNKQAALGFTPVNIAGDAMTGGLTLAGDPTAALGAATKQYVDTTVSTAGGSFLKIDGSTTLAANWDVGAWKLTNLGTPTAAGDAATKGYVDTGLATKENSLGFTPVNKAGDAMTGGLTLSADPTAALGAATKQYVDSNLSTNGAAYVRHDGSVTLSANWDVGAWKLTNVGTPTAAGDAATKGYVDTGLATKENSLGFTPVNKAGDVMTGGLTLAADPTAALGAATKQYVDNTVTGAGGSFLKIDGSTTLAANWDVGAWKLTNLGTPTAAGDATNKSYVDAGLATKENSLGFTPVNKAGDVMTGGLTLAADPTAALGAATKQYVDNTVTGAGGSFLKIDGSTTLAANWDVGAWKLTNLGTPTAAGDATNKSYVDTGLATKENSLGFTPVNKAGDAMTGGLTLSADPTAALGAATKQYVDSNLSTSGAAYVKRDGSVTLTANWDVGAWKLTNVGTPTAAGDAANKNYVDTFSAGKLSLSGGAMTGGLTLAADPTAALGAATKQYVDTSVSTAGGAYLKIDGTTTLGANWDVGAWKLTNLGTPTAAGDAATKGYVDTGLATKENSLGFTPVNKAGDVMTGGLTLAADPTAALGAATKQYVDNTVTGAGGSFVKRDGSVTLTANWDVGAWKLTNLGTPTAAGDATNKSYVDTGLATKENSLGFTPVNKAGDVMTGGLTLAADPTAALGAATKQYVDNTVTGAGGSFVKIDGSTTLAANWDVGAWKLTNLGTPTAASDAATKGYVDTGLATKENSLGFTPVNKAGDAMTGGLTLSGDPTANLGAATKQYVDSNLSTSGAAYVKRDGSVTLTANWDVGAWKLTNVGAPTSAGDAANKNYVDSYSAGKLSLSGGAMTGGLTLAADPTAALGAATKQYVDNTVTGAGGSFLKIDGSTTLAANWDVGAWKLTNLGTPTAAGDAATKGYVDTGLATKENSLGFTPVNKAGDAMTGGLTLSGDPTAALGAATKQYVDTSVSTAGGSYLKIDGTTTLGANWDVGAWKITNLGAPTSAGDAANKSYVDSYSAGKLSLSGGAMTGGLTLAADPTAALGAATKQYVDNSLSTGVAGYVKRDGSLTLTANWDVGAWKLTNLGAPTSAGDAANKSYVDSYSAGKLSLSGGAMTGGLTLAADPTAALGAATKQYVDNTVSSAGGSFVKIDGTTTLGANWDVGAWKITNLGAPTAAGDAATKGYVDTGLATKENSLGFTPVNKAGDVMTGGLTLSGDPTAALGAATKQYVDNTLTTGVAGYVKRDGSLTLTADWNIGGWKLTNIGSPTAATDAANRSYVDTYAASKLSLSGGAMTGGLTLAADPTANLGAATKQYVDNSLSTSVSGYVKRDGSLTLTANWDVGAWKLTNLGAPTSASDAATKNYVDTYSAGKLSLSGGAMTGGLTLAADPTAALGAATKQYVDNTVSSAGGSYVKIDGTTTLGANWDVGAWKITNLGAPTAAGDAATKSYVDTGLATKENSLGFTPVNKAGDVMTGGLTLSGDPTAALGAATKQYVDNSVTGAVGSYVKRDGSLTLTADWNIGGWKLTNIGSPTAATDAANRSYVDTYAASKLSLSGGAMTGGLTLAADPTANLGASTKQYVDSALSTSVSGYVKRDGSLTLTANWNVGGWLLNNVGTPAASTDAANRSYVDTYAASKLSLSGGVMTGGLTLAADPTANLGAATKQYVDNSVGSYVKKDGTVSLTANWNTGNLTVTAGSFNAGAFYYTSDQRLKKNIETVDGLNLILNMRGVTFNWRNNNSSDIGLIAQEVEAVAPQLVATGDNGYKAVKYGNVVGPLVEATKSIYGMCLATQDELKRIDEKASRALASVQRLDKDMGQVKDQIQDLKNENLALKNELKELKKLILKKTK